jgi:hypothetical protein
MLVALLSGIHCKGGRVSARQCAELHHVFTDEFIQIPSLKLNVESPFPAGCRVDVSCKMAFLNCSQSLRFHEERFKRLDGECA